MPYIKDVPAGFSVNDFRDPKIFRNPDGSYGCIVGNRTEDGSGALLIYRSEDGFDWKLSENPIGYLRGVTLENGEKIELSNMERPQIYIENGKPFALLCACMKEEDYETLSHSFNIRLKLD